MKKIVILVLLSVWMLPELSQAQSVTIESIPASSFCGGESISIKFSAVGAFGSKNAFTLQLSNASGSFASGFMNLTSIIDTLPGTFTLAATIPTVANSMHYRFRILATDPYMTSADNGSDIQIGYLPQISLNYSTALAAVGSKPVLVAGQEGLFSVTYSFDSVFWEFGNDAIPTTAVGKRPTAPNPWEQDAMYLTGGKKMVRVHVFSGGCSKIDSFPIEVFGCNPRIPSYAQVVAANTFDNTSRHSVFWVNPGVRFDIQGNAGHDGSDTVFAEAGSTVSGCLQCVLYMKKGSTYIGPDLGVAIIYDSLASVTYVYDDYPIQCSSLSFNYDDAPPNGGVLEVHSNIPSFSYSISPNPAIRNVTVSLTGNLNRFQYELLDILGISRKSGITSDHSFQIDVSDLSAGNYYLRINGLGGIPITKTVVIAQ